MGKMDYTPLFHSWRELQPEEFIEQLFVETDMDGVLNLAQWHVTEMDRAVPGVERHHMNWTMGDKDRILRQYGQLHQALVKIAPYYDEKATAFPQALHDDHLREVWDKYLQPLDGGDVDLMRVKDIADRVNTRISVQNIAASFAKGKPLDDYEKDLLIAYMDIAVSDEEMAYLQRYQENLRKEAQRRVGGKYYALELIEAARWACRTIRRDPPAHILRAQLVQLAYYFAINGACVSMEILKNTEQLWRDMLAMECEDEELELSDSPKKTNSVKSLVPVYVVQILKEKTDSARHMRQTELLEELRHHEVFVERKALNRAVHTLADSSLPIRQDRSGVWYEQ